MIYKLKLHESTIVETTGRGFHTKWEVTRVPGGWYYYDTNPNRTTVNAFFVPFNNDKMGEK